MLSHEDNQLLWRVGPGTPMGRYMHPCAASTWNSCMKHWLPCMLSSELPAPASDPVRVLLLGERLIGFRDSSGAQLVKFRERG
jgi:phthalate 4,5-dioxygenase oxygenase subunit